MTCVLLAKSQLAEWRNGRRWGLKIPCPNGHMGSTPISATIKEFLVLSFELLKLRGWVAEKF